MKKALERFFKYISFDTKSDEDNLNCPSSKGQLVLGKELVKELKELGLEDAYQDEHGYVYATLKGNVENVPTIGFIAHMDTSPAMDGKCVNPQIVNYEGGDIKLNDEFSITVKEFPFLEGLKGQTLITTDGTTLLGSDDKSGITIIMEALEKWISNPNLKHGDIKIGFTPDEEIGRGADLFNVEKFGADFAFTLDGGELGELEYENFNAASCKISIQGKSVHPGTAKDTMINAINVAMELHSILPVAQRPEYTEKYEGFYHLNGFNGDVDFAKMDYIIRDHDREKFEIKKEFITKAVDLINLKYGNIVKMELKDSYYNMLEKILPHMEMIELAKKSFKEVGVEPIVRAIRGGTDGSKLSYMGLPTPNIFTGGYNFHGRFEFLSLEQLEKAVEAVVCIAKNVAEL